MPERINAEELMHALCTVKEWWPTAWAQVCGNKLYFYPGVINPVLPVAVICLETGEVTKAKLDNVYETTYPVAALRSEEET